MRILVTGAAGFIGSHLANHYAQQGHEVIGLDNYEDAGGFVMDPRVSVVWGNIRDYGVVEQITEIKPELISHHAAKIDPRESVKNAAFDAMNNYIGTINVADGAAQIGAKVIFASSCAVYGDIGASTSMVEGQFELPNCPYGISKLASEKYLHFLSKIKDLQVVILRYPNVYGARQRGTRSTGVMAIFAYAMAHGLPVTIYGDGTAQYQYCYITDILEVNDAAIQWLSNPAHEFLLTNVAGIPASVNDILATMTPLFPEYEQCPQYGKPRDGEQHSITMAGNVAKSELNWEPKVSLLEGISRVVEEAKREARPA